MKALFLFTLSTTIFFQCSAQFKKIKSVVVSEAILYATVDRPGDLYVTTLGGQILKYDKEGTLKFVYKSNPLPSLFDPRDGARMFAYYRESRKYEYMNPSFEASSAYVIDSAFAIDPWLACSSGDYNLWLIDGTDKSLKKINTRLNMVTVDVKINSANRITDIILLREYQGFLFILIKNFGILIFNSLGEQIRTIETNRIEYFNFLGEELYYRVNDKLSFFDLFSAEVRENTLPHSSAIALLTDERLFLITENTIDIFDSIKN